MTNVLLDSHSEGLRKEPRYGEIPYVRFGKRDVGDGLGKEEEGWKESIRAHTRLSHPGCCRFPSLAAAQFGFVHRE
jgi:hypothetical protein